MKDAAVRNEKLPFTHRISNFLIALLTAAIWIVVIARAVPTRLGDRGIFVSVAEHLLRGGTLYVTAYDNKEPLFYYFVAAQRAFGHWAELLAEVGLIAACSFFTYLLARTISSARSSFIVGFLIIPIIVTGTFYYPGGSTLPATALMLAMLAAISCGYFVAAGAMLGLIFLLKIPAIPVALAAGTAMIVFRNGRSAASGLISFGGATVAVATLVILAMAWRGEFLPFLETIKGNISYSQGALVENPSFFWGMVAHIARVWGRDFYTEVIAIWLALSVGIVALSPITGAGRNAVGIVAACIAAFAATILSLALTGLWPNHNQLFYFAAALAAIAASRFFDSAFDRAAMSTLVAGLCFAYILGGAFPLRAHFTDLVKIHHNYSDLNRVPPETARLLALAPSGTYARIGRYDDRGHAIGLENWTLMCPRFHQGQHEPDAILNRAFECASRSPVILVGADFAVPDEHTPRWPQFSAFIAKVEDLLAKHYTCDANSGLRVCARRP